jgi:aldose sugar dehydrogenase
MRVDHPHTGYERSRMKKLLVVATVLALVLVAAPAGALPRGMRVRSYKGNLNFPVDMAWVKGTRKIFFTEKNSGKVRVLIGRNLKRRPCVNLDVNNDGERGALGITLHPKYRRNHWLYVYYTNRAPLENRVTRFRVMNNRCRHAKRIVGGIDSSAAYHQGGQLEFVGGKLFVSTGENHDPARAQNVASRQGKILRLNPDGSVPAGNPFNRPGNRNPVWSYGHRNPFGLAHRPGTHQLFETENGPQCDDELNRIRKGRNYGWGPGYTCGTAGVGPNPKRPLRRWTPTIVPTDPWWYVGRLGRLSGDLYMGDFKHGRLHRFDLNRKGSRIRSHRIVHNASQGITDVMEGPRQLLYFATPSAIRRITR